MVNTYKVFKLNGDVVNDSSYDDVFLRPSVGDWLKSSFILDNPISKGTVHHWYFNTSTHSSHCKWSFVKLCDVPEKILLLDLIT